jgi:hypothetical protein
MLSEEIPRLGDRAYGVEGGVGGAMASKCGDFKECDDPLLAEPVPGDLGISWLVVLRSKLLRCNGITFTAHRLPSLRNPT